MSINAEKQKTKNIIFSLAVFFLIPVTILFGVFFLEDRRYYLISLLMITYIMLPFFIGFERKKENSRQLVILAVLCAIAIAGRGAFYMTPQVKPILSIIIISAVVFGKRSGFLVGAISGFVSNFFFGQGPWTPWQMLCFGLVGYFAGVIFSKTKVTKLLLCMYGGLATFFIYGGIINLGTLLTITSNPTLAQLFSTYILALPMDLIHSLSTVVFLFLIAMPMIEKLQRVKNKYGLKGELV